MSKLSGNGINPKKSSSDAPMPALPAGSPGERPRRAGYARRVAHNGPLTGERAGQAAGFRGLSTAGMPIGSNQQASHQRIAASHATHRPKRLPRQSGRAILQFVIWSFVLWFVHSTPHRHARMTPATCGLPSRHNAYAAVCTRTAGTGQLITVPRTSPRARSTLALSSLRVARPVE